MDLNRSQMVWISLLTFKGHRDGHRSDRQSRRGISIMESWTWGGIVQNICHELRGEMPLADARTPGVVGYLPKGSKRIEVDSNPSGWHKSTKILHVFLSWCRFQFCRHCSSLNPRGSMYGTFTYIWLIFMVNVGKYTIHGSYGNQRIDN